MEYGNTASVRLAVKEDIDRIAELEQLSFSDPWSKEMLTSCFCDTTDIYVIEAEGNILGFSVLDRALITEAELYNIAIAPEARGKGLSHLLMKKMTDDAREKGITRIMLEVRASNEAALRLYTHHGFEKVGLRAGYYRNPTENAILMDLMVEEAKEPVQCGDAAEKSQPSVSEDPTEQE